MAVQVRVPTQLRSLSGGASEVTVEGQTVGEVLGALEKAHPGFHGRLFDDGGKLRLCIDRGHQSTRHVDETPGNGKRIDGSVVYHMEFPR